MSAFYERAVSKRISIVAGLGFGFQTLSYTNNKANVPSPGRFHYQRVTIERRYYFSRRYQAPVDLYVGAYGRLARLTLNDYRFDKQGEFMRDQDGNLIQEKQRMFVFMHPRRLRPWVRL